MTTTTNTTAPSAMHAPVPHHFILTIQTDDGRMVTQDGTVPVVPGVHTRMQTYTTLREQVGEHWGLSRFTVLFFALEPNNL